jgi:hypothetical protein
MTDPILRNATTTLGTRPSFLHLGLNIARAALYSFRHGQTDPPRRLEPEGHDNHLLDLAYSPDGRYNLFASDRPGLRPRGLAPPERVP